MSDGVKNQYPGGSAEPTHLGEEGVPYGSEQAEELVAGEIAKRQRRGLDASRQAAMRALVNRGEVATYHQDQSGFEAELMGSLPPETQQRVRARQQAADAGAGRSLAEGRSLAASRAAAQQAQRAQQAQGSRVRFVELSEEERREKRIERWTSQGYSRTQAEQMVEFNDRERARRER